MKILLLALAVAPAAFWLPATTPDNNPADPYPKNPNVDVLNYAFHLTLSDDTDRIRGRAVIDVAFIDSGETALRFDLVSESGPAPDVRGMRVASVEVAYGRAAAGRAPFEHATDQLHVTLPRTSLGGDRATVTVTYEGVPASGLRIGPNKHGDRTFFSDNWPNRARNWLPTVDHPYDKATNEFIVTAPDRYQVISNGLLVEETDLMNGNRRTHWRQSVPIAPWLYVLGVADFAVQYVDDYRGASIQTWVYAKDRDAGFHDFAVPTKQVLEFYGEYVGPFAYEKLANIQSASVGGGMEAASAIFYGENSVTGDRTVRWRNVVIHEIAHQWFGNAVTEYDWDDVWLSEGFATYFTLLYIEHAYGRDEFVDGLNAAADRIWAWYADNPEYRIVHDNLADMGQVTSIATYQKGAWVLHMLRGLVGDEAFWRGIREYYAEHMNGSATTDDFRRTMEDASGMALGWFFDQWLYRGGNPEIEGSWRYDRQTGAIIIELAQVQDGGPAFRLPLEIGVYADSVLVPALHDIEMVDAKQRFMIPVDGAPADVRLDPRSRTLLQGGLAPAR